MTCSNHAVPVKNICLFSLLVRPLGFDGIPFAFLFLFPPPKTPRISSEHSPKLQIRSHSYLRAVSEVSINRSLDSLDPAGLLTSPKFRSRNESYMRAMSTISQVGDMHLRQPGELVSCWTLIAVGETGLCFKWWPPTLSLNRVLKDLVLSTANQKILNASKKSSYAKWDAKVKLDW